MLYEHMHASHTLNAFGGILERWRKLKIQRGLRIDLVILGKYVLYGC